MYATGGVGGSCADVIVEDALQRLQRRIKSAKLQEQQRNGAVREAANKFREHHHQRQGREEEGEQWEGGGSGKGGGETAAEEIRTRTEAEGKNKVRQEIVKILLAKKVPRNYENRKKCAKIVHSNRMATNATTDRATECGIDGTTAAAARTTRTTSATDEKTREFPLGWRQ